jgi:hypothetical protein
MAGRFLGIELQNHKVVPVNNFAAGDFAVANIIGRECRHAAGELNPVAITNAHDFASVEFSFAASNARR